VEVGQEVVQTPRVEPPQSVAYENSQYKLQTPINHIEERSPLEEQQSFGHTGGQSNRYQLVMNAYEHAESAENGREEI
jgi:hypothetical protein